MSGRRSTPLSTVGVTVGAVTWAVCGVRNVPRLPHPSTAALCLVVAVSLWLAYRAGVRRSAEGAMAVATARAEATAVAAVQARTESAATSNVIVVNNPAAGARAAGVSLGLDDAPWMVGSRRQVELDETEALDIAFEDVMDQREREEA